MEATDILRSGEVGRVSTVFCDDVHLARQHFRLAAEELEHEPTLVGLEWEVAPALARELDEICEALADAARSLWPSWYTTVDERFGESRPALTSLEALEPWLTTAAPQLSVSWLRAAWVRCSAGELPVVSHLPAAEQVRQLARAIDPRRLVCVLSVASPHAGPARIRGLARAAEWLSHESAAKTLLLVPRAWQGHTELDHVTYGAVTYDAARDGDVPHAQQSRAPIDTPPEHAASIRDTATINDTATIRNTATKQTATNPTLAKGSAANSRSLLAVADSPNPTSTAPFRPRQKLEQPPAKQTAPAVRAKPVVSIGPICGKPHPKSHVEKLVYDRIQADVALAPLFEYNQKLTSRGHVVDLVWKGGGLVVELDGPEHHNLLAYCRDRDRDYHLLLEGYTVLRITNAEVCTNVESALNKVRNLVALLQPKPPTSRKRHESRR